MKDVLLSQYQKDPRSFLILSGQALNSTVVLNKTQTTVAVSLAARSCCIFADGTTLYFLSYEMQLHLNMKNIKSKYVNLLS